MTELQGKASERPFERPHLIAMIGSMYRCVF